MAFTAFVFYIKFLDITDLKIGFHQAPTGQILFIFLIFPNFRCPFAPSSSNRSKPLTVGSGVFQSIHGFTAHETYSNQRRDEVYVAAVPLRATKGPAQLLASSAYSLNLWDLQHFMVIVKPSSPPPHSQALVFDIQPKDPENIFAALAVLSGKAIPGVVLMRKLSKLPRSKCWFVGSPKAGAIDMALEFNKVWDTNLRVGHHDCRDYTNGLVEYLTGEGYILERLRSSVRD